MRKGLLFKKLGYDRVIKVYLMRAIIIIFRHKSIISRLSLDFSVRINYNSDGRGIFIIFICLFQHFPPFYNAILFLTKVVTVLRVLEI